MKRLFLLFTLTAIALVHTLAQVFEGEIIYTNTYTSKNTQMTDEQLTAAMGSTQHYFIKDGYYKSVLNGRVFQWQLYDHKTNRLYSKMANTDVVYWNDAGLQGDEVLAVKVNKNVTKILDYPCDEIVMTCKSGVQKYYFTHKIAADPALFEQHRFGNWQELISRTKAYPLKMIIESAHYTSETIVTKVERRKLDSRDFVLPAGMKIEKSPY